MKFINKYKKTVCKYLNWLEFQIQAFRAFCKTALDPALCTPLLPEVQGAAMQGYTRVALSKARGHNCTGRGGHSQPQLH